MKKLRFATLVALMLAALMVLAACGEDKKEASGSGNPGSFFGDKTGDKTDTQQGNDSKPGQTDTPDVSIGGNDAPSGGNDTPSGGINDTPSGSGNETPFGGNDTPASGTDKPAEPNQPAVHEHSFELQNTIESTCYADGEKEYACTGCKETKTESIKSEGHKIENDKCTLCNLEAATNLQFTPTMDGNGFEIIGAGSFNDWELIIPSQYQGKPVVSISGLKARYLSWVYIPSSVTELGDRAFAENNNLETIIFPDTITKIGKDALAYCAITEFVIPEGITEIEDGAFAYCSKLQKVVIPQSVSEIGEGAFSGCVSLTDIVLPEAVTEIEDSTFRDCRSLKSVGSLKNIKSFGKDAFAYCENLVFEDMPAGEFSIEEGSFRESGITSIVLPDSIKEIPESAFERCKQLKTVTFPANLEKVGRSAFSECEQLQTIDLADSIEVIEEYAFSHTAITQLDLPANLKTLEGGAFNDCQQLKSINMPSCEEWGYNTFKNCTALETVCIGSGVKMIPNSAFKGINIQTVTLSEGLEEIGEYAFEKCINLFTVDMPSTLKKIGNNAFYQSGITKVVLPEGFESLGEKAFAECPGLRMVTVNGIDSWPYIYGSNYQYGAFANCKKLEKVVIGAEVEHIGSFAFVYCESLKELDLSKAEKLMNIGSNAFADCTGLTGTVVIPDTVTFIGAGAFLRSGITGVILPKGLEIIDDIAFRDTKIKELTLPEGQYIIYNGAFANTPVKEIVVPANVKLAGGVFAGCSELKKAELYSMDNYIDWQNSDGSPFADSGLETAIIACEITEIPNGFFANCANLKTITIPQGVTKIGNSAFATTGIESITIPDSVTEIGEQAFASSALKKVVIPGSVKTVGTEAFSNTPLKELTIEEGVQILYYGCFSYTQLETVTVPKSVTYVDLYCFGYCDKLKTIYCLNNQIHESDLCRENSAEIIYQ